MLQARKLIYKTIASFYSHTLQSSMERLLGLEELSRYSRTSVMWTPKGRTKSVHNSEVSTLVKLGVAAGHR